MFRKIFLCALFTLSSYSANALEELFQKYEKSLQTNLHLQVENAHLNATIEQLKADKRHMQRKLDQLIYINPILTKTMFVTITLVASSTAIYYFIKYDLINHDIKNVMSKAVLTCWTVINTWVQRNVSQGLGV